MRLIFSWRRRQSHPNKLLLDHAAQFVVRENRFSRVIGKEFSDRQAARARSSSAIFRITSIPAGLQ